MSEHIIKAVHATNAAIRKTEGAKPTRPTSGLLGSKGQPKATETNSNDNIAVYVQQIRAARKANA
jgi:hypothetical protein